MMKKRHQSIDSRRVGFTLLELLVAIALIGILIGMLLPAVRQVRGPARRANCASNLRNLSLATLNYEAVHQSYPQAMGATRLNQMEFDLLMSRMSGLIKILPQLEQQPLHDKIYDYLQQRKSDDTELWDTDFTGWTNQLPIISCPSAPQTQTDYGTTSYTFCIGDMARNIHSPELVRGVFACNVRTKVSEITDGSSNTIAFAEIGTGGKRLAISHYTVTDDATMLDQPSEVSRMMASKKRNEYGTTARLASLGRGHNWADGAAGVSLVNTILPPNSHSAAVGGEVAVDGIYSAASFHDGGVQVAFADGHISFIDEDIDAGDSSAPTPTIEQMARKDFASPYGVWGALGTASGAEVIDDGW